MTGMECLNNVMKAAEDAKEVKYTAFNNMDFSNAKLKNLKFVKCNFNGADFSNAELSNVEFVNCTGNNAIFSNANLYDCKFNNSHFDNANFTRANILDYSNYKTWNDIENSSFKSASFERANIEGMNIDSSDFQNANLGVAELRYNTISNSDFRQANLCSKFERTEFKDTKLENTGLDNIESYKDSGVLFVDGEMRNPTFKDYIDKKIFDYGYSDAKAEGISDVQFMQSVIEHHGIDEKILREAASTIAEIETIDTPQLNSSYYLDLLEKVKNTDTYKNRVDRDKRIANTKFMARVDYIFDMQDLKHETFKTENNSWLIGYNNNRELALYIDSLKDALSNDSHILHSPSVIGDLERHNDTIIIVKEDTKGHLSQEKFEIYPVKVDDYNLLKKKLIDHQFSSAYNDVKTSNPYYPTSSLSLNFMIAVVKECGTDDSVLDQALNVVADKENMSMIEKAKLLQDTLNTEEYKQAFEKEQGKPLEAASAR